MTKKPTNQPNFFGSIVKTSSKPKQPLPDSIPDFRPPNPKAKKIYNAAPLPSPKALYPLQLPIFKKQPPTLMEAQYLEKPTGDPKEQKIILYLIEHRHSPWPFSYLRVAAETELEEEYVHERLKYWAWKKQYGLRRTLTETYPAFSYYSEYFTIPC